MFLALLSTLLLLNIPGVNNTSYQVLGAETSRTETSSIAPQKDDYMLGVKIEAISAIAVDVETGEILFSKNSKERLPIASLTKIMTVLTALEEPNLSLDDIYTVSKTASNARNLGSDINLSYGEKITVHNLIRGALISSGNDAAVALAEYIASDQAKFIELMNKKATSLGLENTNFANPHGLDSPENYSTTEDLAKITLHALSNKVFTENIALNKFSFKSLNSRNMHRLYNTNKLLDNSFLNILGGKTGTTNAAGECLMLISENESGHRIITVLLNSPDRFRESKILIDWVFKAYKW